MSKSPLLFLDFDGVLHPIFARGPALLSKRPLLWQLLDACPPVDVVFSTSWREIYPIHDLIELATACGGEHHADRFIGTLPSIIQEANRNISGPVHLREIAIRAWLDGNGLQGRNWIALDDDQTGFKPGCPNLFLIDKMTGLGPEHVELLIARCQV